jgi:protein gp37
VSETTVQLPGGSTIEWTDYTFNPWWGCHRVSPACQHCYADTWAHRLGMDLWGKNADRRFFGEKHWAEPLKWNARAERDGVRRRVFCASMADVFEDRADLDEHRRRLWRLITETPQLDWLLLTKRPDCIGRMVPWYWSWNGGEWPENVWVGTTVEDQQRAIERIPRLLAVPAPVRFLSCEPLLGPVDLDRMASIVRTLREADPDTPFTREWPDWVICGGESGHGARPLDPAWARSLQQQCEQGGVPFFFKQWGDWLPYEPDAQPPFWNGQDGDFVDGHYLPADLSEGDPTGGWWAPDIESEAIYRRKGKKAAGRLLDGRTWDEVPEVAR